METSNVTLCDKRPSSLSIPKTLQFHICVFIALAGRCLRLIQCSETEVLSLTVRLLLSSLKVSICCLSNTDLTRPSRTERDLCARLQIDFIHDIFNITEIT